LLGLLRSPAKQLVNIVHKPVDWISGTVRN